MSLELSKCGCGDAKCAMNTYWTHSGSHSEDMRMGVATAYVNNKHGVMQQPLRKDARDSRRACTLQ